MKKILTALLPLLFLFLSGCETTTAAPAPLPANATLAVHFIDVGQADSALLVCGDKTMLIDGGNVEDSSLVASYLKKQGVERLDYVICSHAHEDHVGGLSGPLNTCTAEHVLAPVTTYSTKAFGNFEKYTQKQGLTVTVPSPGDSFSLGEANVTILGPVKEYEEPNNTSIVLRVEFGETSFLFTGDAERQAEGDLLDAGSDLTATVLKVGHHGSDTSTSYPFLRAIMPEYAILSVGTDNSYGHPSADTLSRLRDADVTVYRTDLQGTVVAVSDGKAVSFHTEKDAAPTAGRTDAAATAEPSDAKAYIGNINSKVFHLETCSALPVEKNRALLASREEALSAGYSPCSKCSP